MSIVTVLPFLVIFIASEIHNQESIKLIYRHKIHICIKVNKQLRVNVKTNAIMVNLLPTFQVIVLNILVEE